VLKPKEGTSAFYHRKAKQMTTIHHDTGRFIEDERGNRSRVVSLIEVEKVINPREDRWYAWGPDGRKYRVIWVKSPSSRSVVKVMNPHWETMYEIRNYKPISGLDGKRNIPAMIREFISSQFQDGEEMTAEIVGDLLAHAEHENGNGRFVEFEAVYTRAISGNMWSEKKFYPELYKMVENVLIEMFCEFENERRFLVEEHGSFAWQSR
jgi:hypothetical protein